MSEVKITVELSAEDRKLLAGVTAAAKAIGAKVATTKPKSLKPKVTDEDDADDSDDDEDADESDEDEDGDESDDEDEGDESDDDEGGDEDEGPSREDVQNALRSLATASSKANAVKLLKEKGGTEALSKLKPAKFAAVITAAKAATAKAKKAKASK